MPLTCAKVLDPDNIGLEYWHTSPASTQAPGTTTEDSRALFAQKRMQCYDLVKDSLMYFEENAQKSQTATASLDNPETVRNHAYELAFASDDEMFHSVLYDWLIERGLADDLLEVRNISHCRDDGQFVLADATSVPRGTPKT